MDPRRAGTIRLHGFAMVLFALVQGFLILTGPGAPQSQARAHIEVFLLALLLVLVGMNATAVKLGDGTLKVLTVTAPLGAWLAAIHAVGVASFGAKSIHQESGAAEIAEKVMQAVGGLSVPVALVTAVLMVVGLWNARAQS